MDDVSSFYTKKAEELKKEKKFEEALRLEDKATQIKQEEKSENFWLIIIIKSLSLISKHLIDA